MKKLIFLSLTFVLSFSLAVQSCSNAGDQAEAKAQSVTIQNSNNITSNSRLAPDFALQDREGNTIQLSDYRGKVVVLNFWATWCGPCRMEIPGFIKLYEKYKSKGVEFIGISVDRPGWQVVKPFMEEYKINYPIVLFNQNVVMDYGEISGIPTTFIINQNGEIMDRIVGYRPDAYFEEVITKLLNS